MISERLYYVARFAVHEQFEQIILVDCEVPEAERFVRAGEALKVAHSWFQQNAVEIDRFSLVLREMGHSLAAVVQEQHPELSIIGIESLQETILRNDVRKKVSEYIAPSVWATLFTVKGALPRDPKALRADWRAMLRRKGKWQALFETLCCLHHRALAFAIAKTLNLAWRPEALGESKLSDEAVPLSKFETGPSYLYVMNNLPYHAVRQALAFGRFEAGEDSPWPAVKLEKGSTSGQAQLFPVEMELNPYREPEEQQNLVQGMWRQVSELSDLDADVLDMLSAIWLDQARGPNDFARVEVDKLLKLRGLKAKTGEGGRKSGYRPEQKAQLFRAIQHISNLFLLIHEMEVPRPGSGRSQANERREVRSRAFVITDVAGNRASSGSPLDIDEFLIRPGVLFAHFLYGSGRQIALLSSKAIQYDRIREDWEKRLARYFSWQWRNDAVNQRSERSFLVKTLLENTGKAVDERHPRRTRQRLEEALARLKSDQVIQNWRWNQEKQSLFNSRSWTEYWLDWSIVIEEPETVRKQYQYILPATEKNDAPEESQQKEGVSDELFRFRRERKLSQAQMASLLGIHQSYYSHLERGTREITPEMRTRIGVILKQGL